MSGDHPSAYELGQLVGKYEESHKNINSCLKKIDKSLEKGEKKMAGLDTKIERGFADQKLENQTIHTEIEKVSSEQSEHQDKRHLFHVTEEEGRLTRLKRHTPEILTAGGIGGFVSLILLLKELGVI